MFYFYQIIISLLIIVSPLVIISRIIKNKEDKKRFLEKFSFPSKKKIKGNFRRVRVRLSNGSGFYIKWSFPESTYRSLNDPINHRFWKKP